MGKNKKWVDVDEAIKASVVPKKKKEWYKLMIEVPKHQGK